MEIWKDIKGYEGYYQVSNYGNVKSFCLNKKGLLLKKQIDKDGYETIFLIPIKKKNYKVHRLVAFAFLEEIENKNIINHKDSNRSNNHYSNLEWCTHKENIRHSHKKGLSSNLGEKHPSSVLSEKEVLEIRKSKLSKNELSKKYNVTYGNIWKILNFKSWKHV